MILMQASRVCWQIRIGGSVAFPVWAYGVDQRCAYGVSQDVRRLD